jgi:hypothetical protein
MTRGSKLGCSPNYQVVLAGSSQSASGIIATKRTSDFGAREMDARPGASAQEPADRSAGSSGLRWHPRGKLLRADPQASIQTVDADLQRRLVAIGQVAKPIVPHPPFRGADEPQFALDAGNLAVAQEALWSGVANV